MKVKEFWVDFLKGTTIGFAIPIPGVSGGTMAVLTGIFDKIADAVSNLKKDFWGSIRSVFPILLGAALMALVGFFWISKGFALAPFAISALFGGLVLGSTPVITKELKGLKMKTADISRVVIGFLVAAGIGVASALVYFYFNFSIASSLISTVWWIYPVLIVSGFIASSAAVMPGISGSMTMFLMGLYVPIVSLYETLANWKNPANYGIMFGGGACLIVGIVGGFIFTNLLMKKLLAEHRVSSFEVILGFIFGSMISLFINPQMVKTFTSGGLSTNYWVYSGLPSAGIEGTPVWEWILGVLLFILATLTLLFVTLRLQKKEAVAATRPSPSTSDPSGKSSKEK